MCRPNCKPMSSISCQDGARKADLSERYFNGSQQSLLRGQEGMGRDGKGWEGMGRDGKGWEGMGRET